MLKLTKKMKADIKKLKEEDLIVCDACGSDEVSEKMWVDTNSYISIEGISYYKYIAGIDDTTYWCDKCNEEAAPVHISEYEGDKDA
tara:strand:+ start:123 stop:380 length:258 start_codon:yes stop_codon:yes gene_type:complete